MDMRLWIAIQELLSDYGGVVGYVAQMSNAVHHLNSLIKVALQS
jgi:hypothetical protein